MLPLHFEYEDLSLNAKLLPHLQQQRTHETFDLHIQSPLRLYLSKMSPEHFVLSMVLHHSQLDGWALGNFVDALAKNYSAKIKKEPSVLPQWTSPKELQQGSLDIEAKAETSHLLEIQHELVGYKDPAIFQNLNLEAAERLVFWTNAATRENLKKQAAQNKATLFMLLLNLQTRILAKAFSSQELCVWIPYPNRESRERMNALGNCVHLMPLRLKNLGTSSLTAQSLQDIKMGMAQSFRRGAMSERRLKLRPQMSFNLEPLLGVPHFEKLQVDLHRHEIDAVEMPIIINVLDSSKGLRFEIDIARELLEHLGGAKSFETLLKTALS